MTAPLIVCIGFAVVGLVNTGRILCGERADHAIRDTFLIVATTLTVLYGVQTFLS